MNRAVENRLRKLETEAAGRRLTRLFVIEGETKAERQVEVDEMIAGGLAESGDIFIRTGVRRSPASPHFCWAPAFFIACGQHARATVDDADGAAG